jgi:hypothetical protein
MTSGIYERRLQQEIALPRPRNHFGITGEALATAVFCQSSFRNLQARRPTDIGRFAKFSGAQLK